MASRSCDELDSREQDAVHTLMVLSARKSALEVERKAASPAAIDAATPTPTSTSTSTFASASASDAQHQDSGLVVSEEAVSLPTVDAATGGEVGGDDHDNDNNDDNNVEVEDDDDDDDSDYIVTRSRRAGASKAKKPANKRAAKGKDRDEFRAMIDRHEATRQKKLANYKNFIYSVRGTPGSQNEGQGLAGEVVEELEVGGVTDQELLERVEKRIKDSLARRFDEFELGGSSAAVTKKSRKK